MGDTLASDERTYQALLTHAVQNRTWDGVKLEPNGRRLVLTTPERKPIADSGGSVGVSALPATPSALIDPLNVDLKLAPDAPTDRIDKRVTGPFTLLTDDRAQLDEAAQLYVTRCAPGSHAPGGIQHSAGGRPLVAIDRTRPIPTGPGCVLADQLLSSSSPAEILAMRQLTALVGACRKQKNAPEAQVRFDTNWDVVSDDSECLVSARRTQLRPYVAPPALLFVTEATGEPTQSTEFSVDIGRIALVAAIILLLTVGVSVLLATKLVRPLLALTAAAERMHRGELDARVEVRSGGEIGRLAQAFNAMAEHRARIDSQRRAMTNDISHELRNPIGTIRSWLEGAKDRVVQLDEGRLSALLNETLVLQHLVDDLQDLAKAEAGELRLHPEPIDLGEQLEQLAAAYPRVRVEGGGQVHADPVRLRQILTNLVTNALRYGTVVRVRAARVAEHVRIDVSDNGIGIAEADLPHVFDRFWRADRSRTRETGGTGLGLAIVQALVKAHGGSVTVDSEIGRGTRFTITLPGH
ncbi:sensor histidine kinase [Lentzea tibetensis]|uniref:sensor histidine kinase n=1 Tax=Lentzea tibetensis TaxID=2591470 RepID=UPI0016479344|nr:HAMP domain-containing sensor histidine kinase [Lentzea tibetensis]